ncbi:MAG TPA: ABC-2 family transporter protein [Anaerolineales bacterium]|nr:ABC-2 family transporter protein [Anaerolineales bacterium]
MTSSILWQVARLSIHRQFSYRAAILAGLATNLFFGLLRAALIAALYGSQTEVAGLSLQDSITFTGISQAMIAFIAIFGWYDLMRTIYTGQVGSDLLKPISYYSYWLAQDFGRAVIALVARGLPLIVAYALIFDISYPTKPAQWLTLILTLLLAWMVSFNWRFIINLAAFWTPNAFGINRLAVTLTMFLSGFLMPLRFFPDWFVQLCYLTPFPHMVNAVVEVTLGSYDSAQIAATLWGQAAWVVILYLLGQLILKAGVKRLVIQGG